VPAPVLQTDVHMVVTGIVARASVRQEFVNPAATRRRASTSSPCPRTLLSIIRG